MDLHINLDNNHLAYECLEKQADKIGAKGHLGTHIDCYTATPSLDEYSVPVYIFDCTNGMPLAEDVLHMPSLEGKVLVFYTGNLYQNEYGTQEYYSKIDTSITKQVLTDILEKKPSFILIDSYGIGKHGEEHISLDKQCEASGCYVIENICISPDQVDQIKTVHIKFDLNYPSTGKLCSVTY